LGRLLNRHLLLRVARPELALRARRRGRSFPAAAH
jgi:hypothetical protein